MQIIINTNEINSALRLNMAVAKLFQRFIPEVSQAFLSQLDDAQDLLEDAIAARKHVHASDLGSFGEREEHFNAKLNKLRDALTYDDGYTTVSVDSNLNMIVEIDSDKLCAIMDVFTEEAPAFGGLAIAVYGVIESFKAIGQRIGRRLGDIMAR